MFESTQRRMSGTPRGDVVGSTAIKPIKRKGLEGIKYFIYNPDTGEWFTRTPKSWFLIILFYIIFYTCLAAFWFGLLMAYFTTIPTDRPKWTLEKSLVGKFPGLGLRPSQPDHKIDSSMVFLKKNDVNGSPSANFETESNADWAKRIEKYLSHYDNVTGTVNCDNNTIQNPNMACKFEVKDFGECNKYPYGYQVGSEEEMVSPCFYIKLNRIYNWTPQAFSPQEIKALEAPSNIKTLLTANPNKLYIDCLGEHPFDREGLDRKITYFPKDQGIDFKYFPYVHVNSNYHNPALALKINDLEPGRLYQLECFLWGKGVMHDRKHKLGLVRFEVLIE